MVRSAPRKNAPSSNICAFCHFWEGNAQLHSKGAASIEFDDRAKGVCLATNSRCSRSSSYPACQKFQISIEASRYEK